MSAQNDNLIPDSPDPWRGAGFDFSFPRPALVMGILNVTPDSFSDGGRYDGVGTAVSRAKEMVKEGADIIDIGGESTRPNAGFVSEEHEVARVVPVIEQLRDGTDALVSVDTQKPAVARAALATGAHIVNDIAANRTSPEMWEIVAERNAGYVAMHMQGTPQTMQKDPQYEDVVAEVAEFFEQQIGGMRAAGMQDEQVVFDVGVGFGKTLEHNLRLLGSLRTFTKHRRPQLLGVSRKSLFGKLLGLDVDQRLAPSLACASWALTNGVQILRVHDVAETVQAARMIEAITETA